MSFLAQTKPFNLPRPRMKKLYPNRKLIYTGFILFIWMTIPCIIQFNHITNIYFVCYVFKYEYQLMYFSEKQIESAFQAREWNWISILIAYTQINSKYFHKLNVRSDTILLYRKTQRLSALRLVMINCLNLPPTAKATKVKINNGIISNSNTSAQQRKPLTK